MLWFPVILSILTAVLTFWWYWRWSHKRMLQLAAMLPGPPALPIIGNALIFMLNPGDQLKKIAALLQIYGEYVKVWLGPDFNVVVKNPADIRLLLTNNKVNQKGPLYKFMEPFIGPGILTGGKYTLPAGTSLIIPIHEVHRDPRYWDEPLKVKPERFLPENVKKRDINAFIPFSLGPMDCLGRVYATSLIKTLVVWILRDVELEADGCVDDLKLHVAISVSYADGYNVRAKPRAIKFER